MRKSVREKLEKEAKKINETKNRGIALRYQEIRELSNEAICERISLEEAKRNARTIEVLEKKRNNKIALCMTLAGYTIMGGAMVTASLIEQRKEEKERALRMKRREEEEAMEEELRMKRREEK